MVAGVHVVARHLHKPRQGGATMKILKIIVDNKPETCMGCVLKHSHDCGCMKKRQEDSSGVMAVKRPDSRCILKEQSAYARRKESK
jgi:hypothetical protein